MVTVGAKSLTNFTRNRANNSYYIDKDQSWDVSSGANLKPQFLGTSNDWYPQKKGKKQGKINISQVSPKMGNLIEGYETDVPNQN